MKINDFQPIGAVNPYKKNAGEKTAGGTGKKERQQDHIEISYQAKELLDASNNVRPEDRVQLISDLKQSVDSGTYHVEAGKLAEKLLPYMQ